MNLEVVVTAQTDVRPDVGGYDHDVYNNVLEYDDVLNVTYCHMIIQQRTIVVGCGRKCWIRSH